MSLPLSKGCSSAGQARLAAQIKSREEPPQKLKGGEFRLKGDRRDPETQHEKNGDIIALQRYRYVAFYNLQHQGRLRDVAGNLLDTEEDLREVVQEEISIREGDHPSSKNSKDRLLSLNAKYWTLSQEWWRWRSGLHHAFLLPGFELWRSHPKWYMHRDLIEDCAGRQGCCARACGCFWGLDIVPLNADAARARGFKVSNEEKKRLKKLYKIVGQDKDDFRSINITRPSIWGLADGNWKNPFDMIDTPPSYEDIPKNNKRLDRLRKIL
ncbi:hypothetical protein N7535_008487 [Penicillium sp. DV-2018c]|nr:hypothetical protein N7461_002246 [Penicillium sp. DV-2018c]KAJ5563323.1 hypothetical protein N7535_008487 [Penicillium sp. DV-2018c]